MKFCFIILLLVSFFTGFSQNIKNPKATEVTQKDIVKILSSIESFSTVEGKKLAMSIFKISNGSGSAHLIGDDGISENFLITVSKYDEDPIAKVFSVGPFYAPKIISKKDLGNTYVINLQHIIKGKKENHKIVIGLNKIIYQ